MANDVVKKSDFSVQDPAGNISKSAKDALKDVKLLKTGIISLQKETAKLAELNKSPSTNKAINALTKASKDAEVQSKALNTVRKEEIQIEKALEKERKIAIAQVKQQTKEVKEVEKAVAKFNKEQKKAKKLSDDNANAFKRLTKKTNEAQAEFKRLAAQYGVTSTQARKAELTFRKLDDRLRKINNTARDGRRDVGRYGLAFQKVGNVLKGGLGVLGVTAGVAGLVRVIGSAIGVFSGFEKANSNLQAVLGDAGTKGNMDLLKQSAKELGASTAFTASEVAGLQIEFAKLGFDPKQIDDATESTLALAAAAGTELAEAAAVVGATLGGFGLDAAETARVTDVMAKSFSISALDMEKFKEAMKGAAPAAKAVGLSVEKTTALLGTLANAGISGSKAGNNLKTSLINLNKAGLTLNEGLKKVADSEDKLGTAAALVGKNAAASFLVLSEGVEVTANLETQLDGAAGAAQKMADIQLDNLAGDITIMGSAMEGLILSIESGEGALGKFLRNSIQQFTRILGILTGVDKATASVVDTNIELSKSSRESVKENENLVFSYENLSNKENLNAEEKRELTNVTQLLIEKFGDSVAVINEETGALSINIEAIRKKIQASKVLASQAAQALIVEKTRLETAIALAEGADKEVERLKKQFVSTDIVVNNALRRIITASGQGGAALSQALADINKEFLTTGKDATEYNNTLSVLLPRLNSISKATLLLEGNRRELSKVDQELLDIGVDLDDLAKESIKSTEDTVEAKEKENKQTRDRIKLLQEQIKVQNALELRSDEDIALRNITIEGINEEIRRLRALGLEKDKQAGILELEPIKDIDDELEADRKLFEAKNKLIQDELEAERQLQLDLDAINDAKFNSTKNLTELLSGLAKEGTREAELLIRLKKTLAITEIAIDLQAEIAAIRKNNAGKDNQTEINTAQIFEATTVAALGVAGVISAFEGMDDTGTVAQPLDSNGGRLMNIHNNEQIWSKKNVKDGGGRTRDESIGILQSFDQGLLMSPHAFKSLEMGNIVNSSDVNLKGFENAVNAQTAQLDSSMKKNAVHVEVGFNNIGEFFKKMKKEGTTRITTAKGDGGFL